MRISVLVAVILVAAASPVAAGRGLMSAGGFLGTGFSNGGEALEGFQYTEFRPGMVLGGNLLYRLPGGHSVEFGALDFTIEMREIGEKIGSLSLTPVLVSYSFQWLPKSRVQKPDSLNATQSEGSGICFHLDVGAGISYTEFKKGRLLMDIEEELGFQVLIETENPLTFRIGGGAGFLLHRNLSATLDVQVILCDVGTTWEVEAEGVTSPVEEIEKFSAGTTQVGLGLRFWY